MVGNSLLRGTRLISSSIQLNLMDFVYVTGQPDLWAKDFLWSGSHQKSNVDPSTNAWRHRRRASLAFRGIFHSHWLVVVSVSMISFAIPAGGGETLAAPFASAESLVANTVARLTCSLAVV